MHRFLVSLTFLAVVLAGCGSPPSDELSPGDFDDLDVQSSSTTGIILGVVVDQAIRPVKDVAVTIAKPDGSQVTDKTDDLGRFAFANLMPGTYIVSTSHPQFTSAQSTVEVEAGVDDPPVTRMLIDRLFEQTPFTELVKFDGYLSCAYSFSLSSTCVNDYTRVTGNSVPGCEGGCLRDYNVSKAGGNTREYVSTVLPGWQVIIMEETWEPSSDLGKELGFTVSYFSRPDAGHWFGTVNGPSPIRIQFDVGDEHESAQYADDQPKIIPPEGTPELFVFFGAGDGSLAVNQAFQSFQTRFYYGLPPEGWSLANGDPLPF